MSSHRSLLLPTGQVKGKDVILQSRFCQCVSANRGVTVYWSQGKHASYPDNPCLFSIFESFELPGYECKPEDYTLINIGAIKDPKTPWVLYREGWGPGKVGSIYKKLKTRLWMRKILQAIKKIRYNKEQLKNFQRIENLPVTGELDRDTIKAIRVENPDPHLIQNIDKLPLEVSSGILHSKIKGRNIDFIAKANLSGSEIVDIIQKDIHDKALNDRLRRRSRNIDIV
jgi:hypothetical protein